MSLFLEIVGRYAVRKDVESALGELLSFALEDEARQRRQSVTMTLNLVDDAEIGDLHAIYFSDPDPTDIITFPHGDMGTDTYLGDVAISVETASRNALDAGHSTDREIAFLALHGLLHLLGYDDADEAEREFMLARQDQLLQQYERGRAAPW
jgi:probable rRNA maturation factor